MNQFDQEIKNRINSQSYEYKPQAWKSFKKQSGMPMMSTGAKIVLVGCAATVITGSVLFFTLPSNNTPETDNTIIAQEQVSENQTANQNIDTVEFTDIAEASNTIETAAVAATETTTHTAVATAKPKTQTSTQNPAEAQVQAQPQTQVQTTNQNKPKPTYYGRPLEILVDTISSNDFPDYETKPADMLP